MREAFHGKLSHLGEELLGRFALTVEAMRRASSTLFRPNSNPRARQMELSP
ncbi:hypothetical protein [Amycolatopsis sp. NPDC051372]|uniref:hypothetical protein n=1 Tax=unclassified Amycolatopsis TaxID=2618356 RepID=UPI0034349C64